MPFVYIGQVAKHLANLGYAVDVFTRCDRPDLPEVGEWYNSVRVIQINAGTLTALPSEAMLPHMAELTANFLDFLDRQP